MSLAGRIGEFFTRLVGPRIVVRPLPAQSGSGFVRPQLALPPASITRWALTDVEDALAEADTGVLTRAAQLWKACRRDGTIAGVLSTRTEGLVQLPVRYGGDPAMTRELQADFRTICPLHEAALMAADGIGLGVSIGERVAVRGVAVLRRLDPEFLVYRWSDDRFYYRSAGGLLPIEPGDGRWVLHVPGGQVTPWQNGSWYALGRCYIAKEHAFHLRENYSQKLANAARVAYSPQGASEDQRIGFFRRLASWGANPVFDLPPGWEVKLLEGNGRGYEVYQDTIKTCNEEATISLAGQLVTTDGGAGFSNSNIHATIRADLIQSTADALARTINEQVIPHWANERFGLRGVMSCPSVEWDVTPPKDQAAQANVLNTLGLAITSLNNAAAAYGQRVDVTELSRQYGIPMVAAAAGTAPALPAPSAPRALPSPKPEVAE